MTTQLGAQDAQFLYLQHGDVLTHVMSINVYDPSVAGRGRLRYVELVRHVTARCRQSAVYRRRLYRLPGDLDFPYWIEDPHFEPADHISRVRLPRPGNWRQFCRVAERRFAEPMDLERPLWDILVVLGLDAMPGMAPGSYALLQRFHHAAIDGASGARALALLCDLDARGTPAMSPREVDAGLERTPDPATIASRALTAGITSPFRMVEAALRLSPALARAAGQRLSGAAGPAASVPVTRFNARVAAERSFAAVPVPLRRLRRIARSVDGATVNDVILAVCSGALREYLARHGELPCESLVAIAPIDARRRSGREAAPGNDITAMTVPLATQIPDPLQRLRAIQQCTASAKRGKSGLQVRVLAEVGRHLPGLPLAGLAWLLGNERIARRQGNLVISNVPGSRVPLYMNGARQTHQFGMGPVTHGLGLFISANGYHDTIAMCMTADRRLVPDLDFLGRCVEAACVDLERAARAAPRTRQRASRRRPASSGR